MESMQIDKEKIKQRSERLEEAKIYLKKEFIGIDDIIDKFINSVKIWYILPEVQSRPLIVNLWGITGVGKTDLVRKFVNFIDFSDRFCEIQMDSKDGDATIEDYLGTAIESNTMQGILLLDEIQRFRTIKQDGSENNSNKFQDLWMLLSDGIFQSNSKIKQELIKMLLEEDYWEERNSTEENKEDKVEDEAAKKLEEKRANFKYKMGHWEASRLKKLLKLEEDVSTIMKLSKEEKLSLVKKKLSNKETYTGQKYSKLLIIISGNLDEAFQMAGDVADTDIDADVYHEYSKTVDIVKIKKALKFRFKPEQIARFGNMHLIYPILSKASYYNIIKQKVASIIKEIKDTHKIAIKIDDSVYDVVYKNGVFPTQGVRPLMSTISAIVENSLPIFLFEHLNQESKDVIKISCKDDYLFSVIGSKKITYTIPRVLDDIKDKQTLNHKSLVSVHEAGHAIAYAVLYKTSPTQIVSNTANPDTGGFIGTHSNFGSKENLINNTIVALAGRAAEEIVFGKDNITSGAASDYRHATASIIGVVRKYGMDKFAASYTVDLQNKDYENVSTEDANDRVEELMQELYKKAITLVKDNKEFLLKTALDLFNKQKLEPEEFKKIAKSFIGEIQIINAKDNVEVDFHVQFIDAIKKQKKTGKMKTIEFSGSK